MRSTTKTEVTVRMLSYSNNNLLNQIILTKEMKTHKASMAMGTVRLNGGKSRGF